ncbi:unnamed protein product [Acanthosepion pharaonis]|uniref:Uncharacterized protein n=1 Tax=Acanthosepion pharaonis TaxID=158019 RepID=A0A812BNC7_ACAPH|nr:unnamed protein product [Sepia pharaonis]
MSGFIKDIWASATTTTPHTCLIIFTSLYFSHTFNLLFLIHSYTHSWPAATNVICDKTTRTRAFPSLLVFRRKKQASKQVVKVKGQDVVIGEAASDDLPDSCHSDDGGNTVRLEKIQSVLHKNNETVEFKVVNSVSNQARRSWKLLQKSGNFTIFHDDFSLHIWKRMKGQKGDIFIYDR